ncbi:MAG: hypothetical protein GXO75_05030 [Calditrichaeota bacterium]|nr:hypothetical protein [Calditrichota bacterium]
MWICYNCKEENEETFDACWNCGFLREGKAPENLETFKKVKTEIINEELKKAEEIPKVHVPIQRPTSVTVIFWILIVIAIIRLLILILILLSVNFDTGRIGSFVFSIILATLIELVVAFGLRAGENWARMLYLWLKPISIIYGFINPKIGNIRSLFASFFYLIILFVLTRKNVKKYFKQ